MHKWPINVRVLPTCHDQQLVCLLTRVDASTLPQISKLHWDSVLCCSWTLSVFCDHHSTASRFCYQRLMDLVQSNLNYPNSLGQLQNLSIKISYKVRVIENPNSTAHVKSKCPVHVTRRHPATLHTWIITFCAGIHELDMGCACACMITCMCTYVCVCAYGHGM